MNTYQANSIPDIHIYIELHIVDMYVSIYVLSLISKKPTQKFNRRLTRAFMALLSASLKWLQFGKTAHSHTYMYTYIYAFLCMCVFIDGHK